MKLSDQAVGAIMMALQKGILENSDITNLIKGFNMIESVDGLIVENPPILNMGTPEAVTKQELE